MITDLRHDIASSLHVCERVSISAAWPGNLSITSKAGSTSGVGAEGSWSGRSQPQAVFRGIGVNIGLNTGMKSPRPGDENADLF